MEMGTRRTLRDLVHVNSIWGDGEAQGEGEAALRRLTQAAGAWPLLLTSPSPSVSVLTLYP